MESAFIGKKRHRSEQFRSTSSSSLTLPYCEELLTGASPSELLSPKCFLPRKEILETMLRCFLMKCLSAMLFIA